MPIPVLKRLTSDLNKIENKSTGTRSIRVKARQLWGSLPATLSTSYLAYCSFVLFHALSVFAIVHETHTIAQSWDTLKSEWGQSANAIVAICAICHVAYVFARSFTVERMRGRADLATALGLSTSWAVPVQSWSTSQPWKTLRQRWPFGMIMDFPDHLMVDDSNLQKVLNPPPEESPKLREELWKELMDGFTWNDTEGILDCLIQGAAIDRPNGTGDYPVHLAARMNDLDILMRTRCTVEVGSKSQDCLLLQNQASETPLEIACSASMLEAVRWIMERLPQENIEARAVVCRAFRSAIVAENLDVLKIIQHLWPAWRTLHVGEHSRHENSPFYFAVEMHKEQAADLLLDPRIDKKEQPKFWRAYELARRTASTDLVHHILHEDRKKVSTEIAQAWLQSAMESPLDDSELFELTQEVGIDVRHTLLGNNAAARLAMDASVPSHRPALWERVLAETYTLDPLILDAALLYMLSCWYSRDDDHKRQQEDTVATLIQGGARDWAEAMEAGMRRSYPELKANIEVERNSDNVSRMLNVRDQKGFSILTYAVALRVSSVGLRNVIDLTDLIMQHGGTPTLLEVEFNKDLPLLMLLVAENKAGIASDALRMICTEFDKLAIVPRHQFRRLNILLRSGADPTLENQNGDNPRVALLKACVAGGALQEAAEAHAARNNRDRPTCIKKAVYNSGNICRFLRRWENYYRDPSGGKPSDQPDDDWAGFRDQVVADSDEDTWAFLVAKNPEGYRVVTAGDAQSDKSGVEAMEVGEEVGQDEDDKGVGKT